MGIKAERMQEGSYEDIECSDAKSIKAIGCTNGVALAVQHGHVEIVRLLLDAGEDPNRYNPNGNHGHSTPLHQAVWSGHDAVVRLLVERGARLDIRDTIYEGTPLSWAEYGGRTEIADYLRARAAKTEQA